MNDLLELTRQELETIHASCDAESASERDENRASRRSPFPVMQMLGPCGSWGLPTQHMFCEVRCHDLSQGGISFFLPRPPTFETAVIGLGKPPTVSYYVVKLIHFREYGEEKERYLVGCQFISRVSHSQVSSTALEND
jgi:hypothetical protein